MVDVDVRLGLSGSDLAIRNRTFESDLARRAETNVAPQDCIEWQTLIDVGLGDEVIAVRRFRGQDFVTVRKGRIVDVLTALRDAPATACKLVSDILGIDLLELNRDARFEVVYSLYSIAHHRRSVVKAEIFDDDPTIDTVSGVWPAANWPEREIYDLFGVSFVGHPDLRRILMPDDWIGHPLRKDFPLGGEEVEFSHNVRDQETLG